MTNFRFVTGFILTGVIAMVAANSAWPQSVKKPKNITLQSAEKEFRKSVFSGNEANLGALWLVEANCQSGPVPDVRIRKAPSHGELEFREMDSVVELRKDSARAHCNGKPVTGVSMFYKSNADFTGTERMEIEVDYKIGLTRRYVLLVDVR